MYDRKWLEMQVVRMGEKYPTRVGLCSRLRNEQHTDHCISGQILHDAGMCVSAWFHVTMDHPLYAIVRDPLWYAMVNLNNAGVPWGLIPKMLGLVPGEQPAIPAVAFKEAVCV